VKYNKTQAYPTEYEAVNAGSALLSSEKLWAVVVFDNVDDNSSSSNPNHLVYKIRQETYFSVSQLIREHLYNVSGKFCRVQDG
jgi:hypothetical protein